MLRLLHTLAILLLASAPTVAAQEILILGGNGDLHSVDPNTGQATFIGLTGFHSFFWTAMAQDSQGRLYASTGNHIAGYEIYEIDPNTGQGTFVVQTNLFGISCMAFGSGDVVYIGNDRTAPLSTRPIDLHSLDLSTGVATLIGDTGIFNMLAMDYYDGSLWGYTYALGLVQIDPITALATDVNPDIRGPLGLTSSMCFNDDGTLYYLESFLWMLDTETGVNSLVNWLTPFGFWAEAVFVEGPTKPFSLWIAGVTGSPMGVKVAGATPGGQIAIAWAKDGGGPTPIPLGFPCAGVLMNLNQDMHLLGVVTADTEGKAVLGPQVVPPGAARTVRVQAIDLTTCAVSNRVIVVH